MQTRRQDLFTTIRTEGAILPADLLGRVAEGDKGLEGLRPEDYHLSGEKLNEAINRAWNRLLGSWQAFQTAKAKLPSDDPATSVTREKWLLPLFRELDYGRLTTAKAVEIEEKSYPISHLWEHTPIHLLGWGIDLDHRTRGVAGAATTSPHSMVQELLNRSDDYLWAFLSNGKLLRILRDNKSLTRQAFVEFDLEAMMGGEVYADFALLWLLCHQSRVEAVESRELAVGKDEEAATPTPDSRLSTPHTCWLEKWSQSAQQQGTRALDQLRKGVEQAITALGRGFLAHPKNAALRDKLYSGTLSPQDYYRQLLRMVYRLLFLFVAEDRQLLLDPNSDDCARDRYTQYYSTARLRRLAERQRGTRHSDLYHGLILVMEKLGSDDGCPELGLPALGSFLWSPQAIADLAGCHIPNADLLAAVRELAFTVDGHTLRAVDYKNLGAEELGSVYESLLELHPKIHQDAGTFELATAAGHERKTTGSYYTPTSLINCLLDSALDPVVDEAAKKPTAAEAELAILDLKICDPACGSGHFLIAAAHRVGKRLAAVRTGDEEPAPDAVRAAVRDVIGRCIFGVDINPMAVELCKINLWLESLTPGRPLSFLDHHIQCGNSLFGATPALLKNGIPDEAFTPIEGDDKKVCAAMKKQNRDERSGQMTFFMGGDKPWDRMGDLAASVANLEQGDDDTVAGVRSKQKRYENLVKSTSYLFSRFWADTWCAAFVWKKSKEFDYGITEDVFRRIEKNPHDCAPWMREEIRRLAKQYQFFHWHLAFPQVFRVLAADEDPENEQTGWDGGFDCVLSNPPWERMAVQEKEWFAARRPDIATARNAAARRKAIAALEADDPILYAAWRDDLRQNDALGHFVRKSTRYPLTGSGDINTYVLFVETTRAIIAPRGYAGCIVPSGIATDDTTKVLFHSMVADRSLVSLYDFENTRQLFAGIAAIQKFCLVTLHGTNLRSSNTDFVFFETDPSELTNLQRHFSLSLEDFRLLSPNTGTCPAFRSKSDATLTLACCRRHPVLVDSSASEDLNPWGIHFLRMFDMAGASGLFRTQTELEGDAFVRAGNRYIKDDKCFVPLYEPKMFVQYHHRHGTFQGVRRESLFSTKAPTVRPEPHQLASPEFAVIPRYWMNITEVTAVLPDQEWLLAYRAITQSMTNQRCMVVAVLPLVAVNHNAPLIMLANRGPKEHLAFLSGLNSFAFDYLLRQRLNSAFISFFIFRQVPFPCPEVFVEPCNWSSHNTFLHWTSSRSLELSYTSYDLEALATETGCDQPPFRWDEERRFLARCELDAAFFHIYLPAEDNGDWRPAEGERAENLARLKATFPTPRDAVAYIMDTFPIVRRKDEEKFDGEYRTKRVILEIYDAMQQAIDTGQPYQTLLDPPPGPPTGPAGNFIPMDQWDPDNWPVHIHRPREE